MPILSSTAPDGTLTLRVSGRFDFKLHGDFERACAAAPAPSRYVVDLRGATYVDSSALGMLLLLRQRAGGEHADVTLVNAGPEIARVIECANLGRWLRVA